MKVVGEAEATEEEEGDEAGELETVDEVEYSVVVLAGGVEGRWGEDEEGGVMVDVAVSEVAESVGDDVGGVTSVEEEGLATAVVDELRGRMVFTASSSWVEREEEEVEVSRKEEDG